MIHICLAGQIIWLIIIQVSLLAFLHNIAPGNIMGVNTRNIKLIQTIAATATEHALVLLLFPDTFMLTSPQDTGHRPWLRFF